MQQPRQSRQEPSKKETSQETFCRFGITPHIGLFGFEGSADGSVSVHGGDTEQERAEVRPEHLEELDSAAQ